MTGLTTQARQLGLVWFSLAITSVSLREEFPTTVPVASDADRTVKAAAVVGAAELFQDC